LTLKENDEKKTAIRPTTTNENHHRPSIAAAKKPAEAAMSGGRMGGPSTVKWIFKSRRLLLYLPEEVVLPE
jgi:hypothetical protein